MTTADLEYYADIERQIKDQHAIAASNRDRVILHALAEGMTHQQIADATGLTRGRIGQIANRKEGNK